MRKKAAAEQAASHLKNEMAANQCFMACLLYTSARQAGMKTGFYFYVTATNTAQARQQAAYFAELIREVPYDCRPAVDFEQYGSLSKACLLYTSRCV